MSIKPFNEWSAFRLELTERTLSEVLPSTEVVPEPLHEGMRYAVLDGGKRIRPLLTYATAQLVGASMQVAALAGSAVELIHAYSLVHDDMPCMDNDVLRRGKPTVHVAYGQAQAMLVGDSLQPLAFEILVQLQAQIPATSVLEMLRILSHAAGSRGMAGGQAIDLAMVGQSITQPQLEQMHRLKTGALLSSAVLLGAWCGERAPSSATISNLQQYSTAIGLAFQVVDDILDVSADTATLGKTAGKDMQANKPTYVGLLGLKGAQQYSGKLLAEAFSALDRLDENQDVADFSSSTPAEQGSTLRLRQIAELIVTRRS
jgi:farnesyl diphosphate synthase